MKTVNMSKVSLLETVKKNRALHEANYKEACTVFHQKVQDKLAEMLKKAQETAVDKPNDHPLFVQLTPPMNQLKDYDRVIAMLEHSIDDVVQLDNDEFNMYVLDEWHWKQQFLSTNAVYNGSHR